MARVSPPPADRLAEFAADFDKSKKQRGYVPNSWLTLARRPRVFRALRDLREAVMSDPGEVPPALKFMVGEVVSNAAGCRYCTAHNAENLVERGKVSGDKLHALWQFQSSPFFTAAERAALSLALAVGGCPPSVTDAHFVELKKHFSEDAIIEIVSVIALFGWMNRWNDTLATQLEDHPLEFARKHLAAAGWNPGVHAR
ncbi:MAG: carboxymuconolactone decarboxylase family protein [Betaproteobacteria bacterium]|nr:carboxymuconolactone decarboxylase family protein [Betaproteobacteria bacterium]